MKAYGIIFVGLMWLATPVHGDEAAAGATDTASEHPPVSEPASAEQEKADVTEVPGLPRNLASELSQLKPGNKAPTTSTPQRGYLDMALGLMAVLGVIVVLTWLAKRFNVTGINLSQSLKLQSVLSLGTKEKVVIVNVEGRRFLLGVTPQQINILSELDTDSPPVGSQPSGEATSFAQQIKKALKQGKLGEDSKTP
ncbi:MAG: flagellar biosynthetic protein FliO [Ketobacteraceae bacterium]|nr:flagellar biosynthetic protein FliO [Ketobacteraceae bacterium]